MIFLEWATFKTQIANKAILRWEDREHFYRITYSDLETTILKEDPANSDQTDFETNFKTAGNKSFLTPIEASPFATKSILGKKLFKRVIGISSAVSAGANTIMYTNTLTWAKMKEIQVINCEALDKVNLKILDTATGTFSGFPNYQLNQFGFNVNLPKDFYSQVSEFDADIYVGLQFKFEYESVSSKTIGLNLIMNEVV